MLDAFLYLSFCSVRNRIRVRLRRLKQPRYLIGSVVGVAYLYFMVFRRSAVGRPGRAPVGVLAMMDRVRGAMQFFGALGLFVVAAAAWVMPGAGRPIEFTRSEVQFLFQAPISRRQLIHYKLLRGQLAVIFGSAIATFFLRPGSLAIAWTFMVGMWVMLAIIRLHFTGVALRRQSLAEHGVKGLTRQWVPLVIVTAAVAVLAGTVMADWPVISEMATGQAVYEEVQRLVSTGPASWVLWPFFAVVRLPTSGSAHGFLVALPAAIGLLVLNYIFVLRGDASFEEASAAYAETRAQQKAAPNAIRRKVTATPFTLAMTGRPEFAILWKNLILLGRYASLKVLLRFVPIVIALALAFSNSKSSGGVASLVAVVSMMFAAMTVLLGPQIMRNDLRQDLASLAILKGWPVRGAAIIRGELLAPAAVLSVMVWLFIVTGALFAARPGGAKELPFAAPAAYALAAMFVAPALILAQLVVQNGIAILFPAWVTVGGSRPRGIDAMGQRLLMMAGIILTLAVAFVPASLVAGMVGFVIYTVTNTIPVVVPAIIAAVVVIIECVVVVQLLGEVFDRTDVSAVEPSES